MRRLQSLSRSRRTHCQPGPARSRRRAAACTSPRTVWRSLVSATSWATRGALRPSRKPQPKDWHGPAARSTVPVGPAPVGPARAGQAPAGQARAGLEPAGPDTASRLVEALVVTPSVSASGNAADPGTRQRAESSLRAHVAARLWVYDAVLVAIAGALYGTVIERLPQRWSAYHVPVTALAC